MNKDRFRLTGAESTGAAALLLCIALPLCVRMCSPDASTLSPQALAERAAADSAAQARIDSAQQRDDSLRNLRNARKAARRSKQRHQAADPVRDRLNDVVPSR
ncbi:MAG: hypothetical protein JFR38_04610 [Muribaculaceae bacterium]|nr:hypothetical protein [Muribaculaceae bacterium]